MAPAFLGKIRYMKIYSDLRCTALQQKLRDLTESYDRDVKELYSADGASTTPRTFIELWRSEEFDLDVVRRGVHKLDEFHCFVTDRQTIADADIAYALFHEAIPVLSLAKPTTPLLQSAASVSPLYHTLEVLNASTEAAALEKFFEFAEHSGRVFVLEGGDGAGKQTQTALMVQRLRAEGRKVATLDFPNDSARYGILIREMLFGLYGTLQDIHPMMFSALYGLNRHDTLPVLRLWIQRGYNIVLDRYMTANFGFQASKFATAEERRSAIATLETFETKYLSLPPAIAVAYLDLPPAFAYKAMIADGTRGALDLHEQMSVDRKEHVRQSFLWCCESLSAWKRIDCLNDAGTCRLSREEVSEAIYTSWRQYFV